MSSSPGISAFPKSDGNLFEWIGTIEGPPETVYAGLAFRISISFPPNYPYVAPTIKFETPCYHPNFDLVGGAICLDILQDKWSAVYSVQTILLSLQSLFGEPNNASPLNPEAAGLWNTPDTLVAERWTYCESNVEIPGPTINISNRDISSEFKTSTRSLHYIIIKFMRRRAPPSSLRLVPGPIPPRNSPKHRLPSLPPPIFYPTPAMKQTATRGRNRSFVLPSLDILPREKGVKADPHPRLAVTPKLRGPWDHSGCITVSFDVENVLAPLQPAAVNL
ncbi:hypothetical protein C0995_001552 [Termitomyces sp. Mi166|nr:hypothetical protein C0995_001552 [Termitomyces sp. Mi166\